MFSADLKRGSMEMLILAVLAEGTQHGYEIGKHLERVSGERLAFRASTLYSALYRMEDKGLVKGRWVEREGQRRRCYYAITAKGKKSLDSQTQDWVAFSAIVNEVVGVKHA